MKCCVEKGNKDQKARDQKLCKHFNDGVQEKIK